MSIKLTLGISISVLTAIGITGNIAVILVISLTRKLRKKPFFYYVNLAVADFVSLGLCLPLLLVGSVFGNTWPLGNSICKATVYLIFVCLSETCFTLLVISWDRLVAVFHPIRYRVWCSRKWVLILMALTWMLSSSANIPVIISYRSIQFQFRNETVWGCDEQWPTYQWKRAFWLTISFICLIVSLQIVIICVVISKRLLNRKSIGSGENCIEMHRKSWRATKLLIIVAFMAIVSWTPYLIIKTIDVFKVAQPPYYSKVLGILLTYLNAVFNPLIYTFCSKEIRDVLRQIVRRCISSHRNTTLRIQTTSRVHPT